ncbi:hypothetical protein ILUMI_10750 [Ignelater luminosus]|uniref:Uncharacterized protein n=1 Tax=Ignelater luminosus TaxID=2038154 RepID=A0A8K0D2Q1_IGNLU|nr:hypothetical protein ILUMI_10750 [Ignelater luminosus]
MVKKHASVRYCEKRSSIKYIETSEESLPSIFDHQYEEIVRFQEISDDYWSKKYVYLLCCILIGTGNDLVPLTMRLAFQFSGGGLVLLLLLFSLLIGLPLIYMEAFLGRYTRLTNCQMYRMTPIFFGICSMIFVLNVIYQPLHLPNDTYVLVNLLKLLVNPNINTHCLDDSKECYDYKIKGPIKNGTCKYGHVSMICENLGEIRYPMQYQYWKMYKDPNSAIFPYYQILTAVVISWGFVLTIVMKRIQVLGSIVQVAFLIQIVTLTIIYFLALGQDGSFEGFYVLISLNMKQFDLHQIPMVLWYSLCRLGLLVPTGFMTNSAYATFESSIATECLIIVICSVIFAGYYLTVFFSIAGVLAKAIGVNVESIMIRGYYGNMEEERKTTAIFWKEKEVRLKVSEEYMQS